MLNISATSAGSLAHNAAQPEKIHGRVDLPYCDAAKVTSFAISETALPGLSSGDQLYISSGGAGAYRTVLRVEPIAGGSVMIVLDPRHSQVTATITK